MTTTLTLKINGMDCTSCVQTLETGLNKLDGIETCTVNFTTATAHITGNIDPAQVTQRIHELGYETTQDNQPAPTKLLPYLWGRTHTRLSLIALILILPSLIFHELLPMLNIGGWWLDLTALLSMLLAGTPIARSAWQTLRINRTININLLMTIAAIGAVIIGAYTEAGLVMVLFALGEALEGYTANRARHSIQSLIQTVPPTATVLRDNPVVVPVEDLQVGERILVKPGQQIPMDGRINQGTSTINQAPITGESLPVLKTVGDDVFASTINGEGVLHITVTQLAEDNTINRIIHMVQEAQERRAPTQRFIDRFAERYTPAVVILAVLVATIPTLFFGQPLVVPDAPTQGWLYRALALLVVACPCALVISTPVTLVSALSNAAKNGILIKGGAYLETLSRIKAFAFDKTGTLTQGRPTVTHIQSLTCSNGNSTHSCQPCDDLLALAHAVEQVSEHPLAQAITSAAMANGLATAYPPANDVQALVGRGVSGRVNDQQILIASHPHFDQTIPHPADHCTELRQREANGQTPMLLTANDTYLGYITVSDTVRPTTVNTLAQLCQLGIAGLAMLTGDTPATAQAIAQEIGLTDVKAGLLPAGKVTAIQQLQDTYGTVAMVGDGINDAPALATADLGIAMGLSGTAQAIETAHITLMQDDLRQLPYALQLSRAAMRTIRTNIAFSLGLKGAFLLAVLLGTGSLWLAILADVGASLLVTLNGTRLLAYRAK